MGWGLRRSLKLGPLKLNFSKSGVGYSVGVRGFRVGKDAKGRSYTAASIPGMGLYSRTYSGKRTASFSVVTIKSTRCASASLKIETKSSWLKR